MKRFMVTIALVCVCTLHQGTLGAAEVVSPFVQKLNAGEPQTVVVYGTSLTAGGQWTRQLAAVLKTKYGGNAVVKNVASSGKDSNWGLENFDSRVTPHKPDAVFIEFGMNDAIQQRDTSVAQARTNLETMIERTQRTFPNCEIILMSMNPDLKHRIMNWTKRGRPHLAKYYAMYAEVAKQEGLQHIDLYHAWNAFLAGDLDKTKKHIPDGVHPNGLGCRRVITPTILKEVGVEFAPDEIPLFEEPPRKKQ